MTEIHNVSPLTEKPIIIERMEDELQAVFAIPDASALDRPVILDSGPAKGETSHKPLLVVVHPGDYWNDQDRSAERELAEVLQDMDNDHTDVAVLHRMSSVLPGLLPELRHALNGLTATPAESRCYFDVDTQNSLETIADDLIQNFGARQRPRIELLGAYADPDPTACLTALRRALECHGVRRTVLDVHEKSLTQEGVVALPNGEQRAGLAESASADETTLVKS